MFEKKNEEKDIVQYVELFTRAFYKDYENVYLSELPEILGLPKHGQLVNMAYDVADALQQELVCSLFEDKEFLDTKIIGCISDGMGTNAYILSIHPFTVSEDIEITDDTPELNSDYICFAIVSSEDRIYFRLAFLNVEDMSPSPFDGCPVSCIKPFLPL